MSPAVSESERPLVARGAMRRIAAPTTPLCPGLTVGLFKAGGGVFNVPPSPEHRLNLYIGAPVRAECRIDNLCHRHIQVHGDFDLVPAGAYGVWDDDRPTTFLHFRITPALLRATAEEMDLNPNGVCLGPQIQAHDATIEHLASALHAAIATGAPLERLFAESLGTALVARLLHRFASDTTPLLRGGLSKRQLQRVVDHIEAHIDEALSLADLADVAGLSVSHFKAQFRQSMAMPVHQYVIRRRVERAKTLIMSGGAISQVALDAGFAHQSHLARCMRRILGVTPTDIARHAR